MSSCLVLDSHNIQMWVTILFLIIGILFTIAASIIDRVFYRKIHNCTIASAGIVVDNHAGNSTAGIYVDNDDIQTTNYYPEFVYTVGGKPIYKKSYIGTVKPVYEIGDHISIWYNPDNPEEFYIPEKRHNVLSAVLHTAGAFCIVIAIIIICI